MEKKKIFSLLFFFCIASSSNFSFVHIHICFTTSVVHFPAF